MGPEGVCQRCAMPIFVPTLSAPIHLTRSHTVDLQTRTTPSMTIPKTTSTMTTSWQEARPMPGLPESHRARGQPVPSGPW